MKRNPLKIFFTTEQGSTSWHWLVTSNERHPTDGPTNVQRGSNMTSAYKEVLPPICSAFVHRRRENTWHRGSFLCLRWDFFLPRHCCA
eukprot:scaffold2557_cov363-Pavlova_lutheri.AAC.7